MRALAVFALVLAGATAARASTYDPPDCRRGSEAQREAEDLVQQIYEALRPRPASSAPSLAALLETAFAHRCFVLPRRVFSEPIPRHELAVRAWLERGGMEWLRSALKRNERIVVITVPPSFRPWYDGATTPKRHPLAPLVCPPEPGDCGAETRGWLYRAREEERLRSLDFRWDASCRDEKTANAWAACLLRMRDFAAREVLLDGRFKSPTRGELIWTGANGQAWWFDLATSQAIRVVPDELGHGGVTIEVGSVAEANLREAVLRFVLDASRVKVAVPSRLTAYYYRNEARDLDVAAVLEALAAEPSGTGGLGGRSGHGTGGWSFAPEPGGAFTVQHGFAGGGSFDAVERADSIYLRVTREGFVRERGRALTEAEVETVSAAVAKGIEGHAALRAWLMRVSEPLRDGDR